MRIGCVDGVRWRFGFPRMRGGAPYSVTLVGLASTPLGEIDDEVDTLGGLAFMLAGEVPAPGRMLEHDSGWRLEIIDGDERRVTRIRLLPPPETVAAEA